MNRTAKPSNIPAYNREAWDKQVEWGGNPWTIPVGPEVIAAARQGKFSILLTEQKPVPRDWFPPLKGLDVLCLACGGGQQGPVLAAAGANVTVFDNSPRQLERDRIVAEREGLALDIVLGDMADLSMFAAETFDLIFHPVSNVFAPDVRPVWREAYRVLRSPCKEQHGGVLMAGFMNPVYYIFDIEQSERGLLEVKYSIPYSDSKDLSPEQLQKRIDAGDPLEFGHSLNDLIGGQLEAGFALAGFYEDNMADSPLSKYTAIYIATRAIKP